MSLGSVLTEDRSRLFALAYRMLGSVTDAEDVLQDAFIRIQEIDPASVDDPSAFVTTVVARICIDQLRSARRRREAYVGPWLPEPIATDPSPDERAELAESIRMGFLIALDHLNPVERTVFLLHDVFDYEYSEISSIVDRSEVNCRQIGSRARSRLQSAHTMSHPPVDDPTELFNAFQFAVEQGEVGALEHLLADEAELWTDGGGKAKALANSVRGAAAVARILVSFSKRAPVDTSAHPAWINGEPGMILRSHGNTFAVAVLETDGRLINAIRIIVNPDKLKGLSA